MENNFKGGFDRGSEDRRDYGSRKNENAGATGRPRRPRIGRSSQPGGEKLYSSSDERRFIPAGERRSHSGSGNYHENGDRGFGNRGGRRSFGSQRGYGDSDKRGYGDSDRRGYGDSVKRGYGDSDKRGYGDSDRRGYGNSEGRSYSERKGFGTYSDRRNSGDRRDRRGFATDGERRPYGNRAGAGQGRTPGGRRPAARPYGRQFAENQAASGINKMIDRKRKQAEEAYSDFDYAPIPVKEEVRLNKFIANSGMCSRREADNFIQAGVVTVNGEVVTELGTKVRMTDDVRFNGERLKGEQKVYIVMNKPKGYVTTTSDPHAEKTVMDLLKGCKSRVFSVGRLDKNTTGVLMFTNDGEMAEKLTHPSYNKKKIYQVTLNTDLTQEDYDKILAGVMLTDGEIAADELEYIDDSDHRKLGIEIHSGKNRIVRRIFESLGYEVKSLDRVYFAGLTKKGLKKGHWRYLTDAEVNILKIGSYQ